MAFESFNLTTGPIQPSVNMLIEQVEIVFIPQTNQSLGFVTVLDKKPDGKPLGKNSKILGQKKYWGLLSANPTDQEIINIALYGSKWEKHGLNVAYTHHYDNL